MELKTKRKIKRKPVKEEEISMELKTKRILKRKPVKERKIKHGVEDKEKNEEETC